MTKDNSKISQVELDKLLNLLRKLGWNGLPKAKNPRNGVFEDIAPSEYNLIQWPAEVLLLEGHNAGLLYNSVYTAFADPMSRLKFIRGILKAGVTDYENIFFCRSFVPTYAEHEKAMSDAVEKFLSE